MPKKQGKEVGLQIPSPKEQEPEKNVKPEEEKKAADIPTIVVVIPVGPAHVKNIPGLIDLYKRAKASVTKSGQCEVLLSLFKNWIVETRGYGQGEWNYKSEPVLHFGFACELDCELKFESPLNQKKQKQIPYGLIRNQANLSGVKYWGDQGKGATHLLLQDADCLALPEDFFEKYVAAIRAAPRPHIIYGGFVADCGVSVSELGSLMDYLARKFLCSKPGDLKSCYFGEPNTLFSLGLTKKGFPACISKDWSTHIAWETTTMREQSTPDRVELYIDNPIITGPYAPFCDETLIGKLKGEPDLASGFSSLSITWPDEAEFSDDINTLREYRYSHAGSWMYFSKKCQFDRLCPLNEEEFGDNFSDVKEELRKNLDAAWRLDLKKVFLHEKFFVRAV